MTHLAAPLLIVQVIACFACASAHAKHAITCIRCTKLRDGLQVEDYLLDVGCGVWAAAGVWVSLVRPPGEVPGGVLVVVGAGPQGDERLVVDEDLLDTLDSLLLYSLVSGRGILVQ